MMNHSTRFCFCILFVVTAAFVFVSCLGRSEPSKPVYYYTVDYPAPVVSFDRPLPCILRVHRFSVSPPFNSQRMIYADKGLHRNAYAYHQWVAAPGDLLAYMLARDLRHSGAFQAVLTPDAALNATHSVYGWVEHFLEKDTESGCQADLGLHLSIISDHEFKPDNRIVFQKSYHTAADCSSNEPEGLARAMSTALEQLSAAMIMDIYQGLAKATIRE